MMRQAMEQLTTGRDVNVADQARLDDNAIKQSVRRKYKTAKQENAVKVAPTDIKKAVLDMYRGKAKSIRAVLDFGEETYATKNVHHVSPHSEFDIYLTEPSGKGERELYVGDAGKSIQEVKQKASLEAFLGRANFLQRDVDRAKVYYQVVDKSGKVIDEFPIERLPEVLGIEEPYLPRDLITDARVKRIVKQDPDMNRRFKEARRAGASVEQALSDVRTAIRQRDHDLFFDRPEVKAEYEKEKLRRTNEYLRNKQEQYSGGEDQELVKANQQEADLGHTVSKENIEEWNVKATNAREPLLSTKSMQDEESKFMQSMKEQMQSIMQEVPESEWKKGLPADRTEDFNKAVQQAIDCLLTATK
jgi:hypothetical protein